jgi:hypothetical protein
MLPESISEYLVYLRDDIHTTKNAVQPPLAYLYLSKVLLGIETKTTPLPPNSLC